MVLMSLIELYLTRYRQMTSLRVYLQRLNKESTVAYQVL